MVLAADLTVLASVMSEVPSKPEIFLPAAENFYCSLGDLAAKRTCDNYSYMNSTKD